jgi:hypothetical protein
MIKMGLKQSGHYTGLHEWMLQYVGQPGVDWEYVTEDISPYNIGLMIGIKVYDPQKELLVTLRWS